MKARGVPCAFFSVEVTPSHSNLIKNTLATGICVCILTNAEVALICMVANAAFSLLVENQEAVRFWFQWDSKAVQDIKNYWANTIPWITIRIVVMFITKALFGGPSGPPIQRAGRIIVSFLQNPTFSTWWIVRSCLITPIAEETLFRGFFQEKLRNIQMFVFGKEKADSSLHKKIRIVIQALFFGAAHFQPGLAVAVPILVLSAVYRGVLKERNVTLWTPVASHAHFNAGAITSLLFYRVF